MRWAFSPILRCRCQSSVRRHSHRQRNAALMFRRAAAKVMLGRAEMIGRMRDYHRHRSGDLSRLHKRRAVTARSEIGVLACSAASYACKAMGNSSFAYSGQNFFSYFMTAQVQPPCAPRRDAKAPAVAHAPIFAYASALAVLRYALLAMPSQEKKRKNILLCDRRSSCRALRSFSRESRST